MKWYYKLYEVVQKGLSLGTSDNLHGCFLATKELLENTGDFMVPRFGEVCNIAYKFKDHRDRLIRDTVVSIIPALATFSPDAFVHDYLNKFKYEINKINKFGLHNKITAIDPTFSVLCFFFKFYYI